MIELSRPFSPRAAKDSYGAILRIRRSPEKRPVSADSGRSRDREAPAGLTLSRRTVARRHSFSAAEGGARAVAYGGTRRFNHGTANPPSSRSHYTGREDNIFWRRVAG